MPTAISSLAGKYIVDASCGYSHSACVTAIGQVYTWGSNKYHQLGLGNLSRGLSYGDDSQIGSANEFVAVPTRVPGLVGLKVVAVSCGKLKHLLQIKNARYFSGDTKILTQTTM
jgi:alpha-tubulin suppressor-like RCC1 family protein